MVYDKGIISSIRKLGKKIKERRLKPKLSDQPLLEDSTNPELATKAKVLKNWGEVKRVMQEARESGLLEGK